MPIPQRAVLPSLVLALPSSARVQEPEPLRFERALVYERVAQPYRSPQRVDAVEHLLVSGDWALPSGGQAWRALRERSP